MHHKRIAFVGLALLATTHAAFGAEAPSNQALYEMILALQADQQQLRNEAAQARREAEVAEQALARAEARVETLQRELQLARAPARPGDLTVPAAPAGGTHREIGTAASGSVVRVPNTPGNMKLTVEFMGLQPSGQELDYAIRSPNAVSFPPEGGLVLVDPEHEFGGRIALGFYLPGTGTDITARASAFHSDTFDAVDAPAGTVLISTLAGTDEADEDAMRATANHDLKYLAGDIEVGHLFEVGADIDLRVHGGLRYARLDQSLDASYFGGDFGMMPPGTVQIDMDFDGIGPRIGAEGSWTLGHGFSIFGGAAGSLLVGDFDNRYFYDDNNPTSVDADIRASFDDQVIPVLEANLGLGYAFNLAPAKFDIQAGYQVENWFNTYGMPSLPDDVQEGFSNTQRSDMSFHGPFVRVNTTF